MLRSPENRLNRLSLQNIGGFLTDRTVRSMIGYWHDTVVCPFVCLCVTLCIVAKRYSLCKSVWTRLNSRNPLLQFTTFTSYYTDHSYSNYPPLDVGDVWRINWKHTANKRTVEICTFAIAVGSLLTTAIPDVQFQQFDYSTFCSHTVRSYRVRSAFHATTGLLVSFLWIWIRKRIRLYELSAHLWVRATWSNGQSINVNLSDCQSSFTALEIVTCTCCVYFAWNQRYAKAWKQMLVLFSYTLLSFYRAMH